MAQNQNYLIWIDMEMTGLVPETDCIIEVALVITDSDLNTIVEAPVLVVHQADTILDGMDSWNKATHGKSGLIDKVKASTLDAAAVEAADAGVSQGICTRPHITDVRQFHLPGSAFSCTLDATTGKLFPLPQFGCKHP